MAILCAINIVVYISHSHPLSIQNQIQQKTKKIAGRGSESHFLEMPLLRARHSQFVVVSSVSRQRLSAWCPSRPSSSACPETRPECLSLWAPNACPSSTSTCRALEGLPQCHMHLWRFPGSSLWSRYRCLDKCTNIPEWQLSNNCDMKEGPNRKVASPASQPCLQFSLKGNL